MNGVAKKDVAVDSEEQMSPQEQQARLRREIERLLAAKYVGWLFVNMTAGVLKYVEFDESTHGDIDHPRWPIDARDFVTVDACMSTVAACSRGRFYGRLFIPLDNGMIRGAPVKRLSRPVKLLP